MSKELAAERRGMVSALLDHARKMWTYGRGDRVMGLPICIAYRFDQYYRAGYECERRKETPIETQDA